MRGSLRVFHTLRALQLLHELAHSFIYSKHDGLSGSDTENARGDTLVECSVAFLAPHIKGNCRYPLERALARRSR